MSFLHSFLPSSLVYFCPSLLHFLAFLLFFHLSFLSCQPFALILLSLFSSLLSFPFILHYFLLLSAPLFFHLHFFSFASFSSPLPAPSFLSSPSLSLLSGLTKDGGDSANADSLEEVLDILAEEGSDWIYGFFTFLYDVVSSPVERGQEEEEREKDRQASAAVAKEEEEEEEDSGVTSSGDVEVRGVILDLQNQ